MVHSVSRSSPYVITYLGLLLKLFKLLTLIQNMYMALRLFVFVLLFYYYYVSMAVLPQVSVLQRTEGGGHEPHCCIHWLALKHTPLLGCSTSYGVHWKAAPPWP